MLIAQKLYTNFSYDSKLLIQIYTTTKKNIIYMIKIVGILPKRLITFYGGNIIFLTKPNN